MRIITKLFAGALLLAITNGALADVHYVDLNSTNATSPYTNWATAATNIQDAVDAAVAGDEIVVTNGTYASGGRAADGDSTTNRVTVDKPLNLRSVNGPKSTTINGAISGTSFHVRCVYLTNEASLSGFTLTQGLTGACGGTLTNCILSGNTANNGGGAYYCVLYNCRLTGNNAGYSLTLSEGGGGAYYCILVNCTLIGNRAYVSGGGAAYSTLYNCTVTGNRAESALDVFGNHGSGGGAYSCELDNCIVYYNTSGEWGNIDPYNSTLVNNCCTPDGYFLRTGFGNVTNAPLFVDWNHNYANLRLQSNSPCINAGDNSYVTGTTDLDGNPRISAGTVDIGAYEFELQPQLTIAPFGTKVILTWPTNNAGYDYTGFTLQSTTNLASPAVWSTNSPAPVVIAGQNTVTNPITGPQQFYRLAH